MKLNCNITSLQSALTNVRYQKVCLFFIFSFAFINTAWMLDDIFITFRAVDNFLKGYGPVWNIGERVQVYTHPLYYFLLIIGIGIFKHHYWFTLALSYVCLLGTIFLFFRITATAGNMALGITASLVMLFSQSIAAFAAVHLRAGVHCGKRYE